jgi:hypothetical protein
MAEEMNMEEMGERPPMPEMDGANMTREPQHKEMPPEAVERLMRPSQAIAAVLVARLSSMSQEELRMLDSAITPQVSSVLMKLLPELAELVSQIDQGTPDQEQMMGNMGALGGV